MGGSKGGDSGGGKKGGAPSAPDFSKQAMVNQSGPMGSSTWSKDPSGNMTLSNQFTGDAGRAFQGLLGGMASGANFDPATAGADARGNVMDFYESRLNPRWQAAEGGFNSRMAQMGADPGSEAFTNASRDFNIGRNDAYGAAMADSYKLGLGEQEQARANRAQPFMLANGMLGGLPQGNANAPMAGAMAQYNAAKDSASATNSKKGSTMGGLGSIAGSIFGGGV